MKPTITVIRAIGTEFARRILRPLILTGAVVAVILLSVGGWLTTQSGWWWLLEFVFICGTLLFVTLIIAVQFILRRVTPPLSKLQKKSVASFVDKLERVAENVQTPQIVIIFYVIRDILRPRAGNFIETVAHDSKTLAPDLARLRREFED
jgi:MFS family permease